MLQHGDKLRFGGGIRGTDAYSDRFTYIFEKEEAYKYEPAPSPGLQPDLSAAASRQVDKAAERAVIFVELEKEKAAHPAIRQVVDAEQHGQTAPLAVPELGSCTSSGRAWRLRAVRRPGERLSHWAPQSLPRVLELAASTVADPTAFDHPGRDVLRGDGAVAADRGRAF